MSVTIPQLIDDLVAAWNSHNIDGTVEFYAPEYLGSDWGHSAPQRGRAGIRAFLARYHNAFPDMSFLADDTIVDGNRVALVWTARGTHRGAILNIPATGRPVSIRGVSLLTIENEKVKHATYVWDVAGLLRALGLLPEL